MGLKGDQRGRVSQEDVKIFKELAWHISQQLEPGVVGRNEGRGGGPSKYLGDVLKLCEVGIHIAV